MTHVAAMPLAAARLCGMAWGRGIDERGIARDAGSIRDVGVRKEAGGGTKKSVSSGVFRVKKQRVHVGSRAKRMRLLRLASFTVEA